MFLFLYIDPIKQGLKHFSCSSSKPISIKFLYIDPIKQGLKRELNYNPPVGINGFYT